MTDFTPEHYLAAARIAYPDSDWSLQHGRPVDFLGIQGEGVKDIFDVSYGDDYRALREALEKRGHYLRWDGYNEEWISTEFDFIGDRIRDVNPVNAMMKIVVALVEAGVVE